MLALTLLAKPGTCQLRGSVPSGNSSHRRGSVYASGFLHIPTLLILPTQSHRGTEAGLRPRDPRAGEEKIGKDRQRWRTEKYIPSRGTD